MIFLLLLFLLLRIQDLSFYYPFLGTLGLIVSARMLGNNFQESCTKEFPFFFNEMVPEICDQQVAK